MTMEFAPATNPTSATGSRDGSGRESDLTFAADSTTTSTLKVDDNTISEGEKSQSSYEAKKAQRQRGWRRIVRNFTPS